MGIAHESYINSATALAAVRSPTSSLAALKAMTADQRGPGGQVVITSDGRKWIFSATSALAGDDHLVVAPNVGSGRWLRAPGGVVLDLPIGFATLDAAALLTMPAGAELEVTGVKWRVTADFTGGSSSAIGVSSNKTAPTNLTTKGDVLGGAAGDVAATLVASGGLIIGTIGTDMDTIAKLRGFVLKPTETLRFDRITSAFTAGAGFVVVTGNLIKNAGA